VILEVDVNSYLTVEEADNLVSNNLDDDSEDSIEWNKLSTDSKEKLLIKGTRLVDKLPYLGVKYNPSSKLNWPRIINLNKKECPDDVKLGLICQMLKSRRNSSKQELKLQELGVKDYKIKNASITFADRNNTKVDCGIYKSIFDEYFIKHVY
jgi:hypothetical protein